jgi:hypothetical protein
MAALEDIAPGAAVLGILPEGSVIRHLSTRFYV